MIRPMLAALLGLSLLALVGCEWGRKPARQILPAAPELNLVVPRACMVEVRLTQDSYCRGKDLQHMTCYRLVLEKRLNCEQLEVSR